MKAAKPPFVRNATPPRLNRMNTARLLRGLCKEVLMCKPVVIYQRRPLTGAWRRPVTSIL